MQDYAFAINIRIRVELENEYASGRMLYKERGAGRVILQNFLRFFVQQTELGNLPFQKYPRPLRRRQS